MDFDDAKENIQPLASGRNVEILESALHAESQHEFHERLLEQRKEYERMISEYVGDDPLELWYEYIQWVEQSYPKSGKETALDELLAKCLTTFENDERYTQDRRLIKLYIKYIDSEPNPHEFYELLYNKGIGTMVADLYLCWAHYYDYCDNFEKAESVYQKGLDARAQPIEQLEYAHRQFGFSMSQRLLHKDPATRKKFLSSMDEQRIALTSLRAHKHKHVGSIRTGSAIKSYNPGRVEQQGAAGNSSNRMVSVFNDENVSTNANPLNQSAVAPTPVKPPNQQSVVQTILSSTKKQENLREPGPWTKAKMKNSKPVIASCSQKLAFSIMSDEDLIPLPDTENMYAKGIQLPSDFVRKNLAQTDFQDIPVHRDTEMSVKSRPGYDKFFVFPNEKQSFSLEELYAYKYFKKRGLQNNFTREQDKIWECGYDVPIRLPPAFARTNEKQDELTYELEFNPNEDPGPKRKLGFKVNDIYGKDEECSLEENLRTKWIMGELPSQKANEMEMTCAFNRRESIFTSAVERRRSIVMGRRSLSAPGNAEVSRRSILPQVIVEAPRRSILPRKSILITPAIIESELEKTAASEIASTEHKQTEIMPKRKSLDRAENAPDFQSPPISRRKLNENETEQQPKTKFNIFEDTESKAPEKMDRDIFKTPHLPPVAKPRPSVVFQDDDEEPCTTQTFNFYIKAQSISTPKATRKPPFPIATDDDCVEQRKILPANENLSPINSSPEMNEKPKQPFAVRQSEKEMREAELALAEPYDLLRQKLSAIMETTEDTNTISSTTTISSKSSSSEESDCSKRTPLAVPSLGTIPEAMNFTKPDEYHETNKFNASSNLTKNNVDKSVMRKVDHETLSKSIVNAVEEKNELSIRNSFAKPAEVKPTYLDNDEQSTHSMPSPSYVDKTEDLLKFFDKNQTSNKSLFPVFRDETLPSMCQINGDKTDTIPKQIKQDKLKVMADSSAMTLNNPLDGIMSPVDNLKGDSNDTRNQINNKSVFAIFQDETMPSMCPVNIVDDKTETVPKMFGKNLSKIVTENADITSTKPLDGTMPPIDDLKDKVQAGNKSVFSIFRDETMPSMCPVNIVEDKTDTVPGMFGKNQSKLIAEHSLMTSHKPLDGTMPTVEEVSPKIPFPIYQDETMNIAEEMLRKNESKVIAESSVVTTHKPSDSILPQIENMKLNSDDINQTSNKSVFTIFQDDTMSIKTGEIKIKQSTRQPSPINTTENLNPATGGTQSNKSVFCLEEEEQSAAILFAAAHSSIRTVNSSTQNMEPRNNNASTMKQTEKSSSKIQIYEDSIKNEQTLAPSTNEMSTTNKYDDEFYSLLESPVKFSKNKSLTFKNPLPVKDLPACFSEKIRLSSAPNQTKTETDQRNRTSMQISSNKSIFELQSSFIKDKTVTEQLSKTGRNTLSMLPQSKAIEPSMSLLEPMKDPSISLLEPMKEVSLAGRNKALDNQTPECEKDQQFLFNDEIPNTAQFSLNMSSIKNSTVISEFSAVNQFSVIKEESVQIKDESISKTNMELSSFQIQSDSPVRNVPAIVAGSACTLSKPFQHSINNKTSLSPQSDFNITGINLNQTELRALAESESKTERNNSQGGLKISEPRTIRPSIFQYTIKPSFNPMEMTFKEPLNNSPEMSQLNKTENKVDDKTKETVRASFRKSVFQSKEEDQSCIIVDTTTMDATMRGDINPFDADVQIECLHLIDFAEYITTLPQCTIVNRIRPLEVGTEIDISDRNFCINKLIGQGAYGFVYSGKCLKTNEMFAFKQERPPNLWEFYISLEIHSRIENQAVLPALMSIEYAIIANNSSVLISKFCEYGSLLDICNRHKAKTLRNLDELIVMIFANQMLSIVDNLHGANIIHGDIKPDNFLLMKTLNYGNNEIVLKLIDYGRSIDMNFFEGKSFTAKLDTKNFVCTEMLENKPWTFQPDLFCLASTIYTILCGKYMNVKKQSLGLWTYTIADELPPNLDKVLWMNLLHTLINVRNCNSMPNLQNLRLTLKEAIMAKERFLEDKIRQFNLSMGN